MPKDKDGINVSPRYMRPDIDNPVGMEYEDVTIIAEAEPRILRNGKQQRKVRYVKLRCKCGKEFERSLHDFMMGKVRKCRACAIREGLIKKTPDPDVVGMRFGRLTAVRLVYGKGSKPGSMRRLIECKCDCGNTIVKSKSELMRGSVMSCGCLHDELAKINILKVNKMGAEANIKKGAQRRSDNIGKKFNRLTIIGEVEPRIYKDKKGNRVISRRVKVRCDCGREYECRYNDVINGRVEMCIKCHGKERENKADEKLRQNIGKKFNSLTIIGMSDPTTYEYNGYEHKYRRVIVRCDCGEELDMDYNRVVKGRTKSCIRCAFNERLKRKYGPFEGKSVGVEVTGEAI